MVVLFGVDINRILPNTMKNIEYFLLNDNNKLLLYIFKTFNRLVIYILITNVSNEYR